MGGAHVLKTHSLALLIVMLTAAAAAAQPDTDIYLARLTREAGSLRLEDPRNITARTGYDNQPHFTPDSRAILFTSIRDDGQADTYRYDLSPRTITRVTATPESEYSPTPLPTGDGFSAVTVEADSSQRLWRFDLDGAGAELLLPDVEPVGYHAWIDPTTVALFILGDPPALHIGDLQTGSTRMVVASIGRSLHRIPGSGEVSFVHKRNDEEWWIVALDPASGARRPLVQTLPGSEDYAWTPDGAILMGEGASLFVWDPSAGGDWSRVADLAGAGIARITRIAVAPDGQHLALVSQHPEESGSRP